MLNQINNLVKSTITIMFETSIDGFLYIPAWPVYMETEDSEKSYKIKLEYDNKEETYDSILDEAYSLCDGIRILGEWYKNNDVQFGIAPDWINKQDLNSELKKAKLVWERYIKNFNNQEEKDILIEDCQNRVGGGLAAYHEVIRAVRLCRLISMGAPEIVKDYEQVLFIKALVVNRYATSLDICCNEPSDSISELLQDINEVGGYGLMVRDGMLATNG